MKRISLAILVAAFLVAPQLADALVMCGPKKPDGSLREGAPIRLRTACRASEVEVDADFIGLKGRGVLVRDSSGKVVGPVVDAFSGSQPGVVFEVGGVGYFSGVGRTGFNGSSAMRFESADCSGPPLLDAPNPDALLWEAVRGSAPGYENRVWLPDPNSKRLVQTNSARILDSGECIVGSGLNPVLDVAEVREFTPPFSLHFGD